jgi:4'-phosphopantetheinyl transferase
MAAVPELTAQHYALLSDEERARASRFVFERDRTRFVFGRAMLRTILGSALGIPGACVPLEVSTSGKPEIHGCDGSSFNLSHSGIYVAVALTRGRQVGIDIEVHRPNCDFRWIAREYFCPAERAHLEACPAQAEALFFRYWTLKEAYLKAVGSGLSGSLRDLDVSPVDEGAVLENRLPLGGIGLQVLQAPPGYSAAVAASGGPCRVCIKQWNRQAY